MYDSYSDLHSYSFPFVKELFIYIKVWLNTYPTEYLPSMKFDVSIWLVCSTRSQKGQDTKSSILL